LKQHLNTLFVTTDGAYLTKDGQAVVVRIEREPKLRVPIHNLGSIVCFGRIGCTPALMALCGQAGVAISFLTSWGKFQARVTGFTAGNVLLRRQQYRLADDEPASVTIARAFLIGKIANTRTSLLRQIRDQPNRVGQNQLQAAADRMAQTVNDLAAATTLDQLRGLEGDCAAVYFQNFNHLLNTDNQAFHINDRNRRPPRDATNALLSFLYAMLGHDARSACETVGLDPQVGFLHRDRPGRPSLALDLIEEFRPFLADRLALTLINRKQIQPRDFTTTASGAVHLSDNARKTVLTAYQKRKLETITHPFLQEKTTIGLLIHLQARLLARYLRNDLDAYPPFIWK
jgi:CRISPR-associated protein Cas1